ncbi:zinc finger, CCHC-type containing protein [Tanacetum coccineum]
MLLPRKSLQAHTAGVKGSKEIDGLMLMTMEPEIQRNLENLHANDMLKELKTLFAQQAEQELLQTTRDFHSCKQEEGQSVSSYVLKMKGYIENLKRLGHPVTLGLASKKVKSTTNRNPKRLPGDKIKGMGKNKLTYAPKSKIPPPPKREDPAKDSIYHECGETGHWKRNCPQYLAELLKKKKNATSGAGGGSALREGRKLKPGALSLYVGNGQREAVEAIGNFDISLPSGLVIALVKRDTLTKPDKLEPRSIKCIFIGYPKETMGYSFYYPPKNKVLVARNAEFLENSLINQEASGSLEDLEIIQEEDTHPSIDTSLNHEEDDLEIYEPQSDINPRRDLGKPANYKAALLDPESDKWLNAMNVEMQSMKDNAVWVLVKLPPNGKTIGSKWLFKKKTGMDGAVHT